MVNELLSMREIFDQGGAGRRRGLRALLEELVGRLARDGAGGRGASGLVSVSAGDHAQLHDTGVAAILRADRRITWRPWRMSWRRPGSPASS